MEIESNILNKVIGCDSYHKHVCNYGERAYIAVGKLVDVIYWDTGNTWCCILDIIPKTNKGQKQVIEFYKKLRKEINKCYDENGYRID
ncbi:MAG: hypothetical protein ACUVWP_04195 [bacterium]